MTTLLLIAAFIALVGHAVVITAVDSYDGYGDKGPDFRI
jgi:hypothetical protein